MCSQSLPTARCLGCCPLITARVLEGHESTPRSLMCKRYPWGCLLPLASVVELHEVLSARCVFYVVCHRLCE
jgi:hypothetical protein